MRCLKVKKLGNILVDVILVLAFIITCAGTFAEKSVGFGVATIIIIVLFILNLKKGNQVVDSKEVKNLDAKYTNSSWQKIGSYENAYLYINENDKKVLINNHEYNFKDIISAEIMENEKEQTYTATTQNAIFRRTYSGFSRTYHYCSKLQVKIVINSITSPQEYITFISKKTNKNSSKYKSAYDIAQKFISTLQVIIKNNQ